MNKIIYITILFLLIGNTVLLSAPTVVTDTLNLPFGSVHILREVKSVDSVAEIFDNSILWDVHDEYSISQYDNEKVVEYDSLIFKEDYFEAFSLRFDVLETGIIVQMILLPTNIRKGDISFMLAVQKNLIWRNRSVFLLSMKDSCIVDSRRIYYHRVGEAGFTHGRRFYIDENLTVSTRDYSFTEDGITQHPFYQYKINSQGKFIPYYGKSVSDLHSGDFDTNSIDNILQ
jgi:hypothetical protein